MSKALGMPQTGMTPTAPKQTSQLLLCAEQPATDKAKKEAGSPTKEDSMEPREQSQISKQERQGGPLRRLGQLVSRTLDEKAKDNCPKPGVGIGG